MTEANATELIYQDSTVIDPNAKLPKHVHLAGCPTADGDNQRVETSIRDTDVQGRNSQIEVVTTRTTRCCDCGAQEVKVLARN